MHCDKCNAQVSAEDRFCGKCFNTLRREASFALDMGSVLRKNAVIAGDSQISEEAFEENEFTTGESQVLEEPVIKSEVATEKPLALKESVIKSEATTVEPQALNEPVIKSKVAIEQPQILKEPVIKSSMAIEQPQALKKPMVKSNVAMEQPQVLRVPVEKSEMPSEMSQILGETSRVIKNYLETFEEKLGLRKINRRILVTHPALLNYKHFAIALSILLISLIGVIRTPSFIFFAITVVPSGIFLYAISYAKFQFTEKGYVDFYRGQGRKEKTRYFPNGRKEHHVKNLGQGWIITDLTDPSVVNEIKSWE